MDKKLHSGTLKTTALVRPFCVWVCLFFFKPWPSYFHVNEPITKDHLSFKAILFFLEPWPSYYHVNEPLTKDISPVRPFCLFFKPWPSYYPVNEPLTKDRLSFKTILFFWNLDLHISMQMNPSPKTVPFFVTTFAYFVFVVVCLFFYRVVLKKVFHCIVLLVLKAGCSCSAQFLYLIFVHV